jgi:chromosome segregation ATPase
MSLKNDVELTNTRAKLQRLEMRYEELCNDTSEDEHVRELTMRSLKGTINQFKEEIARYEAHRPSGDEARRSPGTQRRRVLNDVELANTRRKLRDLERRCEAHEHETGADEKLRDVSRESLKRLINQLKEEIIWTEVHRPTPREAAPS